MRIFKNILFTTLVLMSTSFYSQNKEKVWELLLENNREEALQLVNKLKGNNDIETLFLKKIIERENGVMQCKPSFIDELIKYDDYENYLFANWMQSFVFGDYLKSGFEANNLAAPNRINTSKIRNSTVKNGLLYLQAITKRYQLDWDKFTLKMNSINTIKK